MEQRNDILSVEPSYYGGESEWVPTELEAFHNDENSELSKSWWIERIGLDKVWKMNIPQKVITVGVIDSGIDFSHPDLINKKSDIEGKSYIEKLVNTYDIVTNNNAEEHVILNENTTAYGDFIQK